MANTRKDSGIRYLGRYRRPVAGGRTNLFNKAEWRRALGLLLPVRCPKCRTKTRQVRTDGAMRRCLACKTVFHDGSAGMARGPMMPFTVNPAGIASSLLAGAMARFKNRNIGR